MKHIYKLWLSFVFIVGNKLVSYALTRFMRSRFELREVKIPGLTVKPIPGLSWRAPVDCECEICVDHRKTCDACREEYEKAKAQ